MGVTALLVAVSFFSCEKAVKLNILRHLPHYFTNRALYGENEKAMQEKNAFILATGFIDTTDEIPPTEIALVSVNNRTIQLPLGYRIRNNDGVTEEYAAREFRIRLKMPSGSLLVSDGKKKSAYTVFYHKGYN